MFCAAKGRSRSRRGVGRRIFKELRCVVVVVMARWGFHLGIDEAMLLVLVKVRLMMMRPAGEVQVFVVVAVWLV